MSAKINEYFELESLGSRLINTLKSLNSQVAAIKTMPENQLFTNLNDKSVAKITSSKEAIMMQLQELLRGMEVLVAGNYTANESLHAIMHQLKSDLCLKRLLIEGDPECRGMADWTSDLVDSRLLRDLKSK